MESFDLKKLIHGKEKLRDAIESVREAITVEPSSRTLEYFVQVSEMDVRPGHDSFLYFCITQDVYMREYTRRHDMSTSTWVGLLDELLRKCTSDGATLREKEYMSMRSIVTKLHNKKCIPTDTIRVWAEALSLKFTGDGKLVGPESSSSSSRRNGNASTSGGTNGTHKYPSLSSSSSAATDSATTEKKMKEETELQVYRGNTALESLCREFETANRVACTSFEIFNTVCSRAIPESKDVVLTAVASLMLSSKIHGDTVPRLSLRALVDAAHKALHADLLQTWIPDSIDETRARLLEIEMGLPREILFDISGVAKPVMAPGGLMDRFCQALDVAPNLRDKALRVLRSEAYRYSGMCWKRSPTICCAAALWIVTPKEEQFELLALFSQPALALDIQSVQEVSKRLRYNKATKFPSLKAALRARRDGKCGRRDSSDIFLMQDDGVGASGDGEQEKQMREDQEILASIGSSLHAGHASPSEAASSSGASQAAAAAVPAWARNTVAEKIAVAGVAKRRANGDDGDRDMRRARHA